MKYLVTQTQLYKLFSKFIETYYGEIHYSESDKEFYYYDDMGERVVIGFNDYGYFYFSYFGHLDNHKSMAKTLEGMFGDNYTELFFIYLKENFSDRVKIIGVE